jgi:hypothetical protein
MPIRIIAHRAKLERTHIDEGSDESLFDAVHAATAMGIGVEIDIRDRMGELVVCHDPPLSTTRLTVLGSLINRCYVPGTSFWAINIKSSGLCSMISKVFCDYGVSRDDYFCFDMAIPDQMHYERAGITVAPRISDVERAYAFGLPRHPKYLWCDQLTDKHPPDQIYADLLDSVNTSFTDVAVVSPELHGRSFSATWEMLRSRQRERPDNLLLCTDYPEQALSFF